MQYSTWLKGTFVPNKDYFFKQHLFHKISYLIFILLYFSWVSSSWDNPIGGGSCHGRRVSSCHGWWIVKLLFAWNACQVGHVKQCNQQISDMDRLYLILKFDFLCLCMSNDEANDEDGWPPITKFEFRSKVLAYCTWAGHLLTVFSLNLPTEFFHFPIHLTISDFTASV